MHAGALERRTNNPQVVTNKSLRKKERRRLSWRRSGQTVLRFGYSFALMLVGAIAKTTDAAGPSLAGPPLVNVLPRGSYLLTFRCDL